MFMAILLCLGQYQPETFAVVPLNGDRYSADRVRNEIIAYRLDLNSPEMIELSTYCNNMGKAINTDELFKLMFTSKDFTHRAGAAFSFGYKAKITDDLYKLMQDEHPLVVLAAKSSCVKIAKDKYKQDVDFGPAVYNIANKQNIDTSIKLWRLWFESKAKNPKYSDTKLSSNQK